ncbi:hypothetical protein HDU83_002413 [Entophlyctis luteolus]|nr:hypothetical protein HDU83_002413 [Entophlyctis luteolus]
MLTLKRDFDFEFVHPIEWASDPPSPDAAPQEVFPETSPPLCLPEPLIVPIANPQLPAQTRLDSDCYSDAHNQLVPVTPPIVGADAGSPPSPPSCQEIICVLDSLAAAQQDTSAASKYFASMRTMSEDYCGLLLQKSAQFKKYLTEVSFARDAFVIMVVPAVAAFYVLCIMMGRQPATAKVLESSSPKAVPLTDGVPGPDDSRSISPQTAAIPNLVLVPSTVVPSAVATYIPKSRMATTTCSVPLSTTQISAVSIPTTPSAPDVHTQSLDLIQSLQIWCRSACLQHSDCTALIVPPTFTHDIELVTGLAPWRLRVDCTDVLVPAVYTQALDAVASVIVWRANQSISRAAAQPSTLLEIDDGGALPPPLLESGPPRTTDAIGRSCAHPSWVHSSPSTLVAGGPAGIAASATSAAHAWLAATGAKARGLARSMYAQGGNAASHVCAAAVGAPSSLDAALRRVFFDDAPHYSAADEFVAWLRRAGGNVREVFSAGGVAV